MEQEKKELSIEQLLQEMTNEFGREPETMKLLSQLNKDAVFEHSANKLFAMKGQYIPPKYKLLMSIAIGAAMGFEHCIETYAQVATRKGISKEEITEAILLARFVKATTVISASTSTMHKLVNGFE